MSNGLTIGQVADELGITVYALRYYEKEGLVPGVERTEGGLRRYRRESVDLVRLLLKLRLTGMPIRDLRDYVCTMPLGEAGKPRRAEILRNRKQEVLTEMERLQECLEVIDLKLAMMESGFTLQDNDPVVQRLNHVLCKKEK